MRLDGPLGGNAHPSVVGREAELSRLSDMARRLATGRGAVVTLLGEAGLGKTTVLEAAIARASAIVDNLRTVHVPGRSITTNAMATIAGVVASAVPVPPSPATRLVEKVTREGAEVLPEDPDVLRAALDIARTATSRRPLMVTVDNLPLSEHGVFPVFTSLAAAAASMPLLLVVTSSSVPPQAQELSTVGSLWVHRLEPLTPAQSVQVVRQAVGSHVPRSVAGTIGRLTGGNPGDMREVCSLLSEDELNGLDPLPDPLPGTAVSAAVYRSWFSGLTPAQRMLVLCTAVFRPRTTRELEEATGVAASELIGVHGEAVLRQGQWRVRFTDPRLPSAVLAFTSQQEIAQAYEAMSRTVDAGTVTESWYRLRAGLPVQPEALTEVQQSAQQLLERGELELAGDVARAIRDTGVAGEVGARAALIHGVAAYHAGHMGLATAELSAAVVALTDADDRYRALVPLLLAMSIRDRMAPFDVADAAIGELAREHPRHAASLAALVARKCAAHLEVNSAEQYLGQAEELLGAAGDAPAPVGRDVAYELELTRRLVRSAHQPVHLGTHGDLASLVRARPADDVMSWDLSVSQVLLYLRTHQWLPARKAVTDLRNRTRRYPSALLGAQATVLGLHLHLALWEVQAAVELLDANEDLFPLHLPIGGSGQCFAARARVLSAQQAAATEWFDGAHHLLLEHPGPTALQIGVAAEQGMLALANGDSAAAVKHYSEALASSGRSADTLPTIHLGLLLAASLTGDRSVHSSLAADLEDSQTSGAVDAITALARLTSAPPEELVSRAQAAISAAEAHLVPALQGAVLAAAERAVERLGREEYAEQVAALSAVPADRDEYRTALLTRARDLFQASGAVVFVRQVETRLATLGAPTDSSGREGRGEPAELTPQEQHIATLVANGASNKQVASTLFVSVRTVELRLTNVYRKLGIRSRRELRELMAQE